MSEPMSSGEIEDVLSSIRRLVSEDLRPAPKAASDKPTTAAPETGGKLLLTPALRVVTTRGEARATTNVPDPEAESEDALVLDTESEFAFVGEDIVGGDVSEADSEKECDAELDDEGTVQEDTDQDDTGQVWQPRDADNALDKSNPVDGEDWLPEASVDDLAADGWLNEQPAKPEPSPDLTRVVSDIAAAVAETDEEWESETGDMPMSGVTWQAPEWVEEAELVDDVTAAQDVIKDIADKAEEAAVAEIMARAAQAEAEAKAKYNSSKAAQAEAENTAKPDVDEDIFGEGEGYFDETVLRDLVRDLIREELSGTLGERITRNVRKLVRAEINRALTARDFD